MKTTKATRRGRSGRLLGAIVVGLGVVIVAFGVVWYLLVDATDPDDLPGSVRAAEIQDDPELFVGEQVRVIGRVERIIPPAVVELDDGLLVAQVPGTAVGQALEEEWLVQVRGEVRMFDLQVIERIAGVDLDPSEWANFTGQPIVIADSVGIGRQVED
jgi:hypothetical protein